MLSKTFRTTLYAIILSISVLQIAAAIMASVLYMPSRDGAKPQVFYASFASFFALMTFIWSIVLCVRPGICRRLTPSPNQAVLQRQALVRPRAHSCARALVRCHCARRRMAR
ncbi:hypothetical protein BDZ89DRAFT_342342 [Hymenopellis radicata]|nr:hypothetical protein BDZ89DRAFT_342342 [Hymenopellis radicata]